MAVSTLDDLAAHSLELVNRELSATLEAARRDLEEYADGHGGADTLLRAADLLHAARGALKIVEVHGGALLAEEMEHTCRHLAAGEGENAEDGGGLEALSRAMVQLPAYVERLVGGGKEVALVLLPLLNDLRSARGKPILSEGTLVLLNAGPFERHIAKHGSVPDPAAGRAFSKVAQRMRPAFQAALLGWIRGSDPQHNLNELLRVGTTLERAATTEQVRQLWAVLGAVLTAIRGDGLEATVALKRLIGQADRQLKRLIDGGEAALVHAPPIELLNGLLYYVARAKSEDERVAQVRETFGLAEMLPGEEQLEKAREGLAGPSIKLMRTVAQAIKEDLSAVKDVLDIFVRTGMTASKELAPQLEMLKKIGDTLGVLGIEHAQSAIAAEIEALGAALVANRVDRTALEKTAGVLLNVEDALDRELVRAVVPGDEAETEAHTRHVTQAVMNECIVNLAKIKEAVVHLVDQPGDTRALDQVKPQLRGITAGLLMLNKTKAMKVLERIGTVIATRLAPSGRALKPEHLERLADAIVSVEYYMETVSAGRADPWYMLENAERCLDLLETLPVAKPAAAGEPPSAAPRPQRKEPSPQAAVMELNEERSDPELVELFIEEAKEEIASIDRQLPLWIENLGNTDALIAVRRSFHTLKGSGRMVGAQLVGEFAWSIESLLNRLINQTLEPSPAMLVFLRDAAAALPQLIDQLELGFKPKADIQRLMKQAESFAEGEAFEPAAESAAPAEAPRDDTPPPAAREEPMDPVLADIFAKEMRGHLSVLQAYVDDAAQHGPAAVGEPLYRAAHTLLGSARMAGFKPALAVAEPLSAHLRKHYEAGTAPTRAGVAALGAAAAEIDEMARSLGAGLPFMGNPQVAEGLAALADAEPFVVAADDAPVDVLPSVLEPEQAEETPAPAVASEPAAAFDPEIAGIFAEEAAELLENAELALQALRERGDAAGVVELKRLLHTLKGGARMAGVAPMGDLSHALESFLVRLGETSFASAELDLVQRALDVLHTMRDAMDAGQMPAPVPELAQALGGTAAAPAVDAAPAADATPADATSADATSADVPLPEGDAAPADEAPLEFALQDVFAAQATDEAAHSETLAFDPHTATIAEPSADDTVRAPAAVETSAARAAESQPDEADELAAIFAKVSEEVSLETPLELAAQAEDVAGAQADLSATLPEVPEDLAADAPQEPAIEELAVEDVAEEPAVAEPAFAQTVVDETVVEDTVVEMDVDGTVGEETIAEETIAEEPVVEEPASEEAAVEAPVEAPADVAVETPAQVVAVGTPMQAPAETPAAPGQPATPPRLPLAAEARFEARAPERAETARVDAALLDSLLNGAGEVSIFQSRLKQQVRSIEFHLGELGQTVARLRDQLRKLEAETEAQILYRHQEDLTSSRDFDPLELDRYSTIQQLSRALAESANDVASINELLNGLTNEADTLLTQQARVTAELQDGLMHTRMVPFQRHVARLARIVRQACADTGKAAELVVEGENSELDRQVLENMLPPFEHLLRNAVVHGIEDRQGRAAAGKPATGRVHVKLKREGAEVLIEVGDDGRGLDLKAIRRKAIEQGLVGERREMTDQEAMELILRPGFSTAGELTQAAGRGVGMDIVDNEIKKLGGSMRIESTAGKGTRFLIRLPYTLAITHALIVNVGDETFALPLPTVEGITRLSRERILAHLKEDEPKLDYGGISYRIQHLGSLVGAAPSPLPDEDSAVSLVLVRAGESSTALLTDSLEGSREIVVKTLGPHIASVPGVTGATILGDGRVIMILDASTLVRAQRGGEPVVPPPQPAERQTTALVVDDSITMRRVTQRLLERRGVKVLTARDGLDAIGVLQGNEVDVILLDIEMPRMDGYQFATHVRNDPRHKDLPIIMITSRSGEKHRAKAIEVGVNDYLGKPYQESQLVAAIEALLDKEL